MPEEPRNFGILHRVAETLARGKFGHGEAIRKALARTTSPHVPEDARRAAKEEAVWHGVNGWVEDFANNFAPRNGERLPFERAQRLLHERYPAALMSSDLDSEEFLAIRRDQPVGKKSKTPEEAKIWKQKQQWTQLESWYTYLASENAARQFDSVPGFREMVIDTVSRYVRRVVKNVVVQEERKADTRDSAPDFNPADLAVTFDLLKEVLSGPHEKTYTRGGKERVQTNYGKNWDGNFYALYAKAGLIRAEKSEKFKEGMPANNWKQFTGKKGDAELLAAIAAHTRWCLAGEDVSRGYLMTEGERKQSVWVFFDGNKNPRVALHGRESGGGKYAIRQLRGEDDTPYIKDPKILEQLNAFVTPEKFSNASTFQDQIRDQNLLATIQEYIETNLVDTLPEDKKKSLLRFLYEADQPIQFLERVRDISRLRELWAQRKEPLKDAGIIFGSVAATPGEITKNTKAYIGNPILYEAWKKIRTVEKERAVEGNNENMLVFSSFPEGRVVRREHVLEATTRDEVNEMGNLLRSNGIAIVGSSENMLGNIPEKDLKETGSIETVTVRVRDLFTDKELETFKQRGKGPTTDEIFDVNNKGDRYKKLGLDLCTGKDAIQILLDEAGHTEAARTLSNGQWASLAMERVSDGVHPGVFHVERGAGGTLKLRDYWAEPDDEWSLGSGLVFRLRK